MDVKKVREQTKPLEVSFDDGDVLHITYRPNALLVCDLLAEGSSPTESIDQAVRVIASWDLTDGGKPVEITLEGLAPLPLAVLTRVLQAVAEDITPGEAKS